jgi:DNA-binding transcriptional LysR family regulator
MEMALLHEAGLLRHFLAVAAERSISGAAQRLAISQPALTKSIRKLEAYFGAPLFERHPRGVSLTAFGETLLPHARRIGAECQFAETAMKALRGGHSGRLRLGAGPFFGAALLPAAIARLQPRFPDLRVELDVGINEVTHPRLFEGELDAVFCRLPEPAELPPSILRQEFIAIESRVVAGKGHPLLAKSRIGARELGAYPWVIYHQDREMVTRLFAAIRQSGAPPLRVGTEVKSMFALIQLLRAGPYLSCVPDALIRAQPELGIRFVPFDRFVWRFAGGALTQRALESYLPLTTLVKLVRDEAAKVRSAAQLQAPSTGD